MTKGLDQFDRICGKLCNFTNYQPLPVTNTMNRCQQLNNQKNMDNSQS